MVSPTVDVSVDDDLVVTVGSGGEGWAYGVTIRHDGVVVTEYGTDFEPWERAGVTILRNIVTTRLDAYESRDRVEESIREAFAARSAELDGLGPR